MIKPALQLKKSKGSRLSFSTFLTRTFILLLLLPAATFAQTYSIFPSSAPSYTIGNDGSAIETGVKFRVTQAGTISAIPYYKVSGITGTRTGQAMQRLGFSYSFAKLGSEGNESFKDAEGDQRAISSGFHYNITKKETKAFQVKNKN